jgi:hypothetical protein
VISIQTVAANATGTPLLKLVETGSETMGATKTIVADASVAGLNQ